MLKKCMVLIFTMLLSAVLTGCGGGGGTSETEPAPETKWTIMYYGDADNNLEVDLLADVQEMKSGFVDGQGVNLIVLFDRIDGESSDSSVFGQNFTDTRLYRITHGSTWRLSGSTQFPQITKSSSYEANMGDAEVLKKFIDFCKANYPAQKYALILSNHGGGPEKKKSVASSSMITVNKSVISKAICWDETDSDDCLYTAEIGDTLTSSESVDLLGLDACLMSSVEFAYQFRNDGSNTGFKAGIMVACPPTETGYGWDYEAILDRLQAGGGDNGTVDATLGGNELYYDPSTLTAQELGAIIVEEQRDSTAGDSSQALTCLDLSKVAAVKTAVDAMAIELASESEKSDLEALRGNSTVLNSPADAKLLHYFDDTSLDEWISYPFLDLYNLAAAINGSASFSETIKSDAAAVMTAVDAFVLYSFANSDFTGSTSYTYYGADTFVEGKSGVHIFFPDGDATVTYDYSNYTDWAFQWWYNSINLSSNNKYGELAWCIDGINGTTGAVGNWFELLDSWYDTSNGSDGGLNGYQF